MEKKKYNLDKMRWEAVLACTDKILENLDIGKNVHGMLGP